MFKIFVAAMLALVVAGCAHQMPKSMNVKMERAAKKPVAAPAKPAAPKAVAAPAAATPVEKPAEKQEQPAKKHWYDRFFRKSAQ